MKVDLYSKRPNLVLGFHGCDETVVQKVLVREDFLKESENKYDWLGTGIYFWQNSKERALQYAQEASKRKESNIKEPAVIGAIIDLGCCLDLLDHEHLLEVKEAYRNFSKTHLELPENKGVSDSSDKVLRYLDRVVIQTLHATRAETHKGLIDLEFHIRNMKYLLKKMQNSSKKNQDSIKIEITPLISSLVNMLYEYKLMNEEKRILLLNVIECIEDIKKLSDLVIKDLDDFAGDIRSISSFYAPYDSVRSVFIEGKSLYPKAGFNEKNHIQICIINPNCIKGFFLPQKINEEYPNP